MDVGLARQNELPSQICTQELISEHTRQEEFSVSLFVDRIKTRRRQIVRLLEKRRRALKSKDFRSAKDLWDEARELAKTNRADRRSIHNIHESQEELVASLLRDKAILAKVLTTQQEGSTHG